MTPIDKGLVKSDDIIMIYSAYATFIAFVQATNNTGTYKGLYCCCKRIISVGAGAYELKRPDYDPNSRFTFNDDDELYLLDRDEALLAMAMVI